MIFLFDSFWFGRLALQKPCHYVRFEKESRYYELRLSQDLFGDWVLILSNGRVKSRLGNSRTQAFFSFEEGLIGFYQAVKFRLQRQYKPTQYLIENVLFSWVLTLVLTHHVTKRKVRVSRKKMAANQEKINHFVPLPDHTPQMCFPF